MLGHLGAILGPSCASLRPYWAILDVLWHSWSFWGHIGRHRDPLWAILGHLSFTLAILWRHLGSYWGHAGTIVGLSWALSG
jgi:hypothetical protein